MWLSVSEIVNQLSNGKRRTSPYNLERVSRVHNPSITLSLIIDRLIGSRFQLALILTVTRVLIQALKKTVGLVR